jgi:hypothetical protein
VFKNMPLRRIFEPKREDAKGICRKPPNEELQFVIYYYSKKIKLSL